MLYHLQSIAGIKVAATGFYWPAGRGSLSPAFWKNRIFLTAQHCLSAKCNTQSGAGHSTQGGSHEANTQTHEKSLFKPNRKGSLQFWWTSGPKPMQQGKRHDVDLRAVCIKNILPMMRESREDVMRQDYLFPSLEAHRFWRYQIWNATFCGGHTRRTAGFQIILLSIYNKL